VVLALGERAQALPVTRVTGEGCVGAVIGHGAGATDPAEPLAVVFRTDPEADGLTYEVEPARAARHMVAGLLPGERYAVEAGLAPRSVRWPERALRTAEENHVNRIRVRAAGAAGAAGGEAAGGGAAAPRALVASTGGVVRFGR
jgi:hypothetical protein